MNQLTEKPLIHADALARTVAARPELTDFRAGPLHKVTSAPEDRPLAGPASAVVDSGHDRREGQSAPQFGHFTSASARRPLSLAHRSVARVSNPVQVVVRMLARAGFASGTSMKQPASQSGCVLLVARMALPSIACAGPRPLPWTCPPLQPLGSMGAKAASSRRHLPQRRGATCGYGAIAFDNRRTSSNQE
jgi:hypothetical protein